MEQHIYDTQCIKMPIFNGDYKPVSDNTLACISSADIKSKDTMYVLYR